MKNFCSVKYYAEDKIQGKHQEKRLANYMSKAEIVLRTYKECSKLNSKKNQTIQLEKWQKTFHRTVKWQIISWEDVQNYLSLGKHKLKLSLYIYRND